MKSLMISSKPVFGADVVRIANLIAADSDTIAFGIFFWGDYLANNFGVGYFLTSIQWDAIVVDNKNVLLPGTRFPDPEELVLMHWKRRPSSFQ